MTIRIPRLTPGYALPRGKVRMRPRLVAQFDGQVVSGIDTGYVWPMNLFRDITRPSALAERQKIDFVEGRTGI